MFRSAFLWPLGSAPQICRSPFIESDSSGGLTLSSLSSRYDLIHAITVSSFSNRNADANRRPAPFKLTIA